ncbi:hypothetical protein [Dinghuibacter silviterrae]|uniref:Circularly permuted ATP-grasp superfamily protein n=1 Tax=Dinghuibacter silviterrae TaxID=1539049 RepID=A0A4R8DS17_9BACT|nr:hypothetical protein [Dinghuibacter silviterrae]TDX01034.1 hypothetical protein EDB95_2065 [Dinghuibacter silviterrae]
MIPFARDRFNEGFSDDKYRAFLQALDSAHPGAIDFRVAETPVFVPRSFRAQMEETCAYILDLIADPSFKQRTAAAIPPGLWTPGEQDYPHFVSFDFGVCTGDTGLPEPRLIELQAFPTLFAFQVWLPENYQAQFPIPPDYDYLLGGYDKPGYIRLLKDIIVGDVPPEEVILLEVKPHEQKTRIDFYLTQDYLDIRPVCVTELFAEGRELFYFRDGRKTRVRRIYNRVIVDDLMAQKETLGPVIDLTAGWDVEWISHPNWFYRVSKYLLPLLHHPLIPQAYFVQDLKTVPKDLDRYVLKPLFSFAGQGVVLEVTPRHLEDLPDPENWILQRKATYADIIRTPDGPAKCEIRLMYFWKDGALRPVPANNLARLSKGQMIGTRYNKDKTWVGGSACFFEP